MRFFTLEQMEKPRKRRLRKKLHLGEFRESGFSSELTCDRSTPSHDDALDHLINFVGTQSWVFDGGDSSEQTEISGYLCLAWVGSLDEADRESVRLWLEAQPWCKISKVDLLSDCQHNFFERNRRQQVRSCDLHPDQARFMPRVGEKGQQICVANALGGNIHQRMETKQLALANDVVEQHLDPALRIVGQHEKHHAAQFDAEVFAQVPNRDE